MKTNTIVKIDLDKIHADERNFFETAGGIEIEQKNEELKDSIEADGLIHPIVVRPRPGAEDEYIIISGHRRKAMFRRLRDEGKDGFGKIPAVIKNIPEGTQARMMLLEANTTQRESTDWEKAQAVKEYGEILDELKEKGEEMPGRRRDHIAAALHISKTQVGQYEKINKSLAPEYKEEMRAGNIGVTVADKLASLPEETQKELHEKNPAPKAAEIQNGIFAPEEPERPEPQEEPQEESQEVKEPEEPQEEKRTGDAYNKALKKMDEYGFDCLEPCEQCTVASCCEKCCKTCQEKCGSKQECRKDKEAEAPLKIYAIQKVVKMLEGMVSTSRRTAEIYEGKNQEQVDKYEAVAKYTEELIEKAKQDLFDLSGINMF
jgi:ParB family chromosome partitioning protein